MKVSIEPSLVAISAMCMIIRFSPQNGGQNTTPRPPPKRVTAWRASHSMTTSDNGRFGGEWRIAFARTARRAGARFAAADRGARCRAEQRRQIAARLRDTALKDDWGYRFLENETTLIGQRLAATDAEARAAGLGREDPQSRRLRECASRAGADDGLDTRPRGSRGDLARAATSCRHSAGRLGRDTANGIDAEIVLFPRISAPPPRQARSPARSLSSPSACRA